MRKIYLVLSLAFVFMLGCENHLEMTLPEGPQGEKGEKGDDGLSAFELWKIYYHKDPNTSFEDFMNSLRGEDGRDGKDGAVPIIGANDNWWIDGKDSGIPARGKDGKDGVTPEIGSNGNWWIDGKDSGVSAEGKTPVIGSNGNWWINGEDSGVPVTGKDGKDGIDGVTPQIGANGTWWIDGQDTGVPVTGKDGKDGMDGIDGKTPFIGQNGNWWFDCCDTGVPATGEAGKDGVTPNVGYNGNWWIGDKDTGVPVTGKDGKDGIDGVTPQIGGNGNWYLDGKDTGIPATGKDGKDGVDGVSPIIGSNGNWFIDGCDTGVPAEGKDGVTPFIGNNGNWYIDGKDTSVPATGADGVDGVTPIIGVNGNWWIDGKDTGQPVQGLDGIDGVTPTPGSNGNWWIDGKDTGVSYRGKDGEAGKDGITPLIGWNGNWFIDGVDTGVPAVGKDGKDGLDGINGITPHVGCNGNWWVGEHDTGVPVRGLDGVDGITPEIGSNGNWWINGEDTGYKAVGKDGADGKDGVDGINGKTSYELWKEAVENGDMTNKDGSKYEGGSSWEAFLRWLQGGDVSVLHQYWLSQGNTGDLQAFIEALFDCHCDGISIIVFAPNDCLDLDSEGKVTSTPNATLTVSADPGTKILITGDGISSEEKTVGSSNSEVKFTIPRTDEDQFVMITATLPGGDTADQVTKNARIPALKYVKFNEASIKKIEGEEKDIATVSFEDAPIEFYVDGALVYDNINGVKEESGWSVSEDGKTFKKAYERRASVRQLTFKAIGDDAGCSVLKNLLEIPQLTPVAVTDVGVIIGECDIEVTLKGDAGMTVVATPSNDKNNPVDMIEGSPGVYTATGFPRTFAGYTIDIIASKEGAGNVTKKVTVDSEMLLPANPFTVTLIGNNSTSSGTPSLEVKLENPHNKSIEVLIKRGNNSNNASKKRNPWITGVAEGENKTTVTIPANGEVNLDINKDVRDDFGAGNYRITFETTSFCGRPWSTSKTINNQRDFAYGFRKMGEEGGNDGSGYPGPDGEMGGSDPYDPEYEVPTEEDGYTIFEVWVTDALPGQYVQFMLTTSAGYNSVWGAGKKTDEKGNLKILVKMKDSDIGIATGKKGEFKLAWEPLSEDFTHSKDFTFEL